MQCCNSLSKAMAKDITVHGLKIMPFKCQHSQILIHVSPAPHDFWHCHSFCRCNCTQSIGLCSKNMFLIRCDRFHKDGANYTISPPCAAKAAGIECLNFPSTTTLG